MLGSDSVVAQCIRFGQRDPSTGNAGHKLPLFYPQTLTMGTYYTTDENNRVNGIMTVSNIYEFGGFTFEFSNFLGPLKLNKDLTPSACMGRKFYKAFEEWNKLTKEEKLDTLIFG